MSPSQIALWLEYHDVVLNDNITKTNCYNMPLSFFLIIDIYNNTKSHLVAQSLVSDETVHHEVFTRAYHVSIYAKCRSTPKNVDIRTLCQLTPFKYA